MFFCDYPIIRGEKQLPLYLLNMGQQHCQDHILRPEGYPQPQILYCTKGSGTLLIDEIRLAIPPYTAIFLPANYPHEYFADGDIWDIHWVVPAGYGAEDILRQFGLTEPKIYKLGEIKMLEHIFRKALSSRPMEYIAKRRIQAAKELLTGTDGTIEDIASETGFCTSSYFCKLFKKYEGITPTHFRKAE